MTKILETNYLPLYTGLSRQMVRTMMTLKHPGKDVSVDFIPLASMSDSRGVIAHYRPHFHSDPKLETYAVRAK